LLPRSFFCPAAAYSVPCGESGSSFRGGDPAMLRTRWLSPALALALAAGLGLHAAADDPPPGVTALVNGTDLKGWKVPPGDNGHWKVVGGVIDYDARSEAKGDKNLWTEKSYRDFVLRLDWRFKTDQPGFKNRVPIILPDGSHKKDEN